MTTIPAVVDSYTWAATVVKARRVRLVVTRSRKSSGMPGDKDDLQCQGEIMIIESLEFRSVQDRSYESAAPILRKDREPYRNEYMSMA